MLKRPLCSSCPVYIGPRLAPRPCALSLRQDSLPPAGPEQGLEPRSEASPAVPATIAIPEPCQCFLVWGRAQSQHPSVRLSAGLLACVLPCINPTSQGLSLVLYPFLTKEPAHIHIWVSTPKRLQLLLSGHRVAACLHPHLNKREEPGAGMLAVWQCRHLPHRLPHVLWVCPCPSWPALEAGNQCRLTLEPAWVWAL